MNGKIRISAAFYGYVQGVGFRSTASHAASMLGLTGWVRNEYDGSVSSEVQGDMESIDQWIKMIGSGRFIEIDRVDCREIDVDPEERSFRVRY